MASSKRAGTIAITVAEWLGVVIFVLVGLALFTIVIVLGWVGDSPDPMGNAGQPSSQSKAAGGVAAVHKIPAASPEETASLFAPVYKVLVSPRCMNCHPDGDRPLSDREGVHAMNVSRRSFESGLQCSTCHSEQNAELPGAPVGPPGAPHWQLPPKEAPMVFQNRTITALCKQLRDPAHNGNRKLEQLLEHVTKDPLVLWGWSPGGQRKTPPLSHAQFVTSFRAWVDAGGICPGETAAPNLDAEPPTLPHSAGA